MPDSIPPLEGNLVVLRDWRRDDIDAYRDWLRPHHDWHNWDGPYFPAPTDGQADQSCEQLGRQVIADDWPTPRELLVVAERISGRLIGTVAWSFESEPSDWRRIGIALYDPDSRSAGRGTEALRLWTDYLFRVTQIVRLDLATWSGNTAMCRVAAKLGWVEEARFRDARVVRGARFDSVVYAILRRDWVATGSCGS